MSNTGCLICGADLVYVKQATLMKCSICGEKSDSNATCTNGHYICDNCHQTNGVDFIENICLHSDSTDPLFLANFIMKHESIKPHGPEHHFLVPAVLLTAYYNIINKPEMIKSAIMTAKKRSSKVLGGFCGFYGNCGAGVGNGIFISIVLNATPLSEKEYQLANLITAKTLLKIAESGGPRCCKRNTFIAIETASEFLSENLNVKMPIDKISCQFNMNNKECKLNNCKYF
ncbi:MAG: DUF5714 domain-containing protein [Bacteroidales bacterium]|nr:DUF5714 domain-containing protein [Bacteroidales bacterium]